MPTSNETADIFFEVQKSFQEYFGIHDALMEVVEDCRACRWEGTDLSISWEDPKQGWLESCMNVLTEAIHKDGLTLYLAENNGNVSWMVFDDAKRVEDIDDERNEE